MSLFESYGISSELCETDKVIMDRCRKQFEDCEAVRDAVQLKVLNAFIKNRHIIVRIPAKFILKGKEN